MDQDLTESKSFKSEFNAGIHKLYSLRNLINHAHEKRISDNHLECKAALDEVYNELWAYMEKDYTDQIEALDKHRTNAQTALKTYIEWQGSNLSANMKNHIRQIKQLDLEEKLDIYQRHLIKAMKTLGMDMPKKMGGMDAIGIV